MKWWKEAISDIYTFSNNNNKIKKNTHSKIKLKLKSNKLCKEKSNKDGKIDTAGSGGF